jgi:hypothetical protein
MKSYLYLYKFSSVTLVTGSQSLFAEFAGLLRLQVLGYFVSSLFSLPFPHFISGLCILFLPPGDQVNIRFGHL